MCSYDGFAVTCIKILWVLDYKCHLRACDTVIAMTKYVKSALTIQIRYIVVNYSIISQDIALLNLLLCTMTFSSTLCKNLNFAKNVTWDTFAFCPRYVMANLKRGRPTYFEGFPSFKNRANFPKRVDFCSHFNHILIMGAVGIFWTFLSIFLS